MGLEMSGFELNTSQGKKSKQQKNLLPLTVIAEHMLWPAGLNFTFRIIFKSLFSCVNNNRTVE